MSRVSSSAIVLAILYTMVMTGGDAVTKHLTAQLTAVQFYALGAMGVALFCVFAALRSPKGLQRLKLRFAQIMFLRSVITLVACLCFYQAFTILDFAEVFLFIAIIPVITAILAGPILHEKLGLWHVVGFGLGALGVAFLFTPEGASGHLIGYICAAGAAVFAALSLVLERWFAIRGVDLLAQLFYPYAFVALILGAALPFAWHPIDLMAVVYLCIYAALVFMARSLSVMAMRHMPAAAITPIMNVQFIWMVLVGMVFFNEMPNIAVIWGAMLVILSGVLCVHGSHQLPHNNVMFKLRLKRKGGSAAA